MRPKLSVLFIKLNRFRSRITNLLEIQNYHSPHFTTFHNEILEFYRTNSVILIQAIAQVLLRFVIVF